MDNSRQSSHLSSAVRILRVDHAHDALVRSHATLQLTYRRWDIWVERRAIGLTLPRVRFSVRIVEPETQRGEYLSGFLGCESAVQAAQRRIDAIVDIQDPPADHASARRRRKRGQ